MFTFFLCRECISSMENKAFLFWNIQILTKTSLHSFCGGNQYSPLKAYDLLGGKTNTQFLALYHNMNIATSPPNPIPNVNNDIFSSKWLLHPTLTLLLLSQLPSLIGGYFTLHGFKGHPLKHLFFWNDVTLNVENCVPVGIGPHKLLNETSKTANIDNFESSWGISPINLYFDKSNCSKVDISKTDADIYPFNWFPNKFNNLKLLRLHMIAKITLVKLLLDKSTIVFVASTYVRVYLVL